MKREEVELFIKIQSQFAEMSNEISSLSKKAPNDALNKFKLQFVNNLLVEANNILGEKYKPFGDFKNFDENSMPTNSDVVMILSQYLSCLENFRADNIQESSRSLDWVWIIDEKESDIQTKKPVRLQRG